MDGLSQAEGEYMRHAASQYEKAVNEIQKTGIDVSTDILSAYVNKLVWGALGLWVLADSMSRPEEAECGLSEQDWYEFGSRVTNATGKWT